MFGKEKAYKSVLTLSLMYCLGKLMGHTDTKAKLKRKPLDMFLAQENRCHHINSQKSNKIK